MWLITPGWLIFLLFFLNHTTWPADTTISKAQVRQWFEWGEYLLIVENVPVFIAFQSDSLDSTAKAELHLYLGVAFFAIGKIGQARNEFLIALQLHPPIRLEEEYVEPGITDLFNACVNECRQNKIRQEQEKHVPIPAVTSSDDSIKKEQVRDAKAGIPNRRNPFIPVAVVMSVLTLGLVGISAYEYHQGDDAYQDFLQAAQAGDYREYSRLRDEVRKKDNATAYLGAAAGVTALISAVLYIYGYKTKVKHTHASDKKVSCTYQSNSFNVVVQF